jgi:hypothetical protein
MIIDIPFINKYHKTYINKYNDFQVEPIFNDIGILSMIFNKSYDLYTIPIYMNSRINYVSYQDYDNFHNLLNGQLSYRPISNSYNKINTHYIPKLQQGHKIKDMIIPIKTDNYPIYEKLFDISNIIIIINNVGNNDDDIKLNIKPKLYIRVGRWNKKNMIEEEYELLFEMTEWSYFKPINKLNINMDNILYIIIDGHDFIYIDNYIDNIDKSQNIYLRLFI